VSAAIRVWRLRKNSTWLDVRLSASGDGDEVELQFFRDNADLGAAVDVTRRGHGGRGTAAARTALRRVEQPLVTRNSEL
jgi:hypothetical protein